MSTNETASPVVEKSAGELGEEDRIEVTAFLERKTWILDKIKLLESLPPVDVFSGVDKLLPTNTGEPITGLPTRKEVADWLTEHEKIESETEQFDKGDMIRLKKFAKAKSQQSLSPEDTDLIELTLETLFSLDKLMHLLRERRNVLEQMEMRLRWEELRVRAWKDRKAILDDVDNFVKNRARWSPSAYDELSRDSNSLAPPDTAPPLTRSPTSKFLALARSSRFMHAETLSREAAGYASRVMGFHNNCIKPSGDVLDKLIERRTVPDQLLDEQDRLEDQTRELDQVAKFPMLLVMQWKKADEVYGELKKDQAAARALKEEIGEALKSHPRSRTDEEFLSRNSALNTRLSQISDPLASRSFPRPTNPLYPDQKASNDQIATALSTELRTAIKAARQAAASAKQYHAVSDAVRRIRKLTAEMAGLTANFTKITDRLKNGSDTTSGDGSPPNVQTPQCLEPLQFSAFVALLPPILTELQKYVKDTDVAVKDTRATLLALRGANLEESFRPDTEAMVERLLAARADALRTREEVESALTSLKGARSVWTEVQKTLRDVSQTRESVVQALDRQRWKVERARDGAPLTPESPTVVLPGLDFTPEEAERSVEAVLGNFEKTVGVPCTSLLPALGPALADHLRSNGDNASLRINALSDLIKFWADVRAQAHVMKNVRDQTHEFERRIDDIRISIQDTKDGVLRSQEVASSSDHSSLVHGVETLQEEVDQFTARLSSTIPYVTRANPPRPSAYDHLPFVPSALDQSVKAEGNAFAMSLSGGMDSLRRHLDFLRLAIQAKTMDIRIKSTEHELRRVETELDGFNRSFEATQEATSMQDLQRSLEDLRSRLQSSIGDSPSHLRVLLADLSKQLVGLESAPGAQDSVTNEAIVVPRKRALSQASRKCDSLMPRLQHLQEEVSMRLSATPLGSQLQSSISDVHDEVAQTEEVLAQLEAKLRDFQLGSPDDSKVLDEALNQVSSVGAAHAEAMISKLAAVRSSRLALQNASSFRDVVVFTLARPLLDQAVTLESSERHLQPRFTHLTDTCVSLNDLIKTADKVKEATSIAQAELQTADSQKATLSLQLDSVPVDVETLKDLEALQVRTQQSLEDYPKQVLPTLRGAEEALKTLLGSKLANDSRASALVGNRSNAVTEVLEIGSRHQKAVSTIADGVAQRLSVIRQAALVDISLKTAEEVFNTNKQQLLALETSFQGVKSSLPSQDSEASKLKDLPVLKNSCSELVSTLTQSLTPLLKEARLSVTALQSVVDGSSDESCRPALARRNDRLANLDGDFKQCHATARALLESVSEADAQEFERMQQETRQRDAAEQERLRLEQEEKERVRAEAAAAREAEIERKRQEAEDEVRRMAEETARREEAERQARLTAELETKKISDELAKMKEADERRRQAEAEAEIQRKAQEAEEARLRVEREAEEERLRKEREVEEQLRMEREAEEQRLKAEQEAEEQRIRAEREAEDARLKAEADAEAEAEAAAKAAAIERENQERLNVGGEFVLLPSPVLHKRSLSLEEAELKTLVSSLRNQLRSLGLGAIIRPPKSPASIHQPLPTLSQVERLQESFNTILTSAAQLPAKAEDGSLQAELRSLQFDLQSSRPMMLRIQLLGNFSTLSTTCDSALSDLLEHLDSYPSAPAATTSAHQTDQTLSPEDQLSNRVGFTSVTIDSMKAAAKDVMEDERVAAEKSKLEQTWKELWEMSMDKINGVPSRPPSSICSPSESGSRLDIGGPLPKAASFTNLRRSRATSSLSVSSPRVRPGPSPNGDIPSRSRPPTIIGKGHPSSRSVSRVSNRSISGPIAGTSKQAVSANYSPTVFGSTFASRQRTTSTSSVASNSVLTPRRTSMTRPRPSDAGSATPTGSRSTLPSIPRTPRASSISKSPLNAPPKKRKEYIPNHKHRVDVAVAKVVNELEPEVSVNVEPVSWKDQSGKYWIGDKDPKLYFCRILRSHTVMVRVGGGWVELSKFLRGHYEMFRVAPPAIPGSPPREEEERWISSATLLSAPTSVPSPTTPEPRRPARMSLSPLGPDNGRMTPVSRGSRSPIAHSQRSSPLTPLQFLRKAEDGVPPISIPSVPRPSTPSKSVLSPSTRIRPSLGTSTSSASVSRPQPRHWRP